MEIKINEKYRIKSDTDNVILQENKTVQDGDNKGNQYWQNIGYFPWLDWAYRECLRREILSREDLKDIKSIIDTVEKLHMDFKKNMNIKD